MKNKTKTALMYMMGAALGAEMEMDRSHTPIFDNNLSPESYKRKKKNRKRSKIAKASRKKNR